MNKGMSEIVQGIARIVFPFIMVFGISVVLYGHLTPGGGFAGGVVLSGGFVLLLLAFGQEYAFKVFPRKIAKSLDSIGALGFLGLALFGLGAGAFFKNYLPKGEMFRLWSGGTILFSNIMIGLKIGSALFLAIITLSMSRLIHVKKGLKYKQSEDAK
jgi:multicomponent Na+:H+ antiporter subunit B